MLPWVIKITNDTAILQSMSKYTHIWQVGQQIQTEKTDNPSHLKIIDNEISWCLLSVGSIGVMRKQIGIGISCQKYSFLIAEYRYGRKCIFLKGLWLFKRTGIQESKRIIRFQTNRIESIRIQRILSIYITLIGKQHTTCSIEYLNQKPYSWL